MRRIKLVLVVALTVAVLMVSAAPAMAHDDHNSWDNWNQNSWHGWNHSGWNNWNHNSWSSWNNSFWGWNSWWWIWSFVCQPTRGQWWW
jgi:hypothetical protein